MCKKEVSMEEFEAARVRVSNAQDTLLTKLFGHVPENPGAYDISREEYTKAMEEVEKEYGLVNGDPDLILFVLEQLSRSPRFIEKATEEVTSV